MSTPEIEVIGVYSLQVTKELFQEQFTLLYGYKMSKRERKAAHDHLLYQLSTTVLVEAMVRNRDDKFDLCEFTQPQEGVPEDNWQVPWAEAYLTLDGKALAVDRLALDPPASKDLRLAFFIHFWQPKVPLRTMYGDVSCPEVQEMPDRLSSLVPYEPLD